MRDEKHYARALVEALAACTNQPLTAKGVKSMAQQMDQAETKGAKKGEKIGWKYLWYDLYHGKGGKFRESKLNVIADFIGKHDFRTFVNSLENSDPILQGIIGDYYCYIRTHYDKEKILRSPVRIEQADGKIKYHLKGNRLDYAGEVKFQNGCLYVLMQSNDGTKSFYHVYRIGGMEKPVALQGIFSGVSSDFHPIGGRAVLLRTEGLFDELKTGKLNVETLKKSRQLAERRVAEYFQTKTENNLAINPPSTFDTDDLGKCP